MITSIGAGFISRLFFQPIKGNYLKWKKTYSRFTGSLQSGPTFYRGFFPTNQR